MNKKFLVILAATVMLASTFTFAFSDLSAQSGTGSNVPYAVVTGAYPGNVTIYANGTVSNTSVVSHSGNTYTLLSDINGTITDQANNSVLNGNGYTINGNGNTAVLVHSNLTGLEIENLMVVNSSVGFSIFHASNILLNNVTVVGTSTISETMVYTEYSSNITVQNSNFEFNSTVTSSYGVYAYYVTSLNVSYNAFSGSIIGEFVYANFVISLSAWNNTIMSSFSSNNYAFEIEDGVSASLGYNYVNNTNTGVTVDWEQYFTSTHNQFYNTSSGAFYVYYSTWVSSYDVGPGATYGAYIYYDSNTFLQYDNFNGSEYGIYNEYSSYVTVAYSNLSSTYESVYAYYTGTFNLYYDQMYVSGSNDYVIYTVYQEGWINLVGDHMDISNGYGLYLYYSPQFTVVNSFINATDNIYLDTLVQSAYINNNTFITNNGGYTVYFEYYDYFNNFVFTNNTATGYSTTAYSAVWEYYSYYGSSNIIINGNTFTNFEYPVYLYGDYYGFNVQVNNNKFYNSTDAIVIYYYGNVTANGNTIINSSYGIYLYSGISGPSNVSNNFIENLPGYGDISYAITVDYFYSGSNIVSHNTVINLGTNYTAGYGLYVEENIGALVYDNYVYNTYDAYFMYDNNPVNMFNNVANVSEYGIYSEGNYVMSYYGNTVINANYSFYSYEDEIGSIYANTFVDNQVNISQLYFMYFYYDNYGVVTVYHNNFLNQTTNSTTLFYNDSSTGLYMNAPLPVGGNYYSNYTGTGVNGIGTTPMNVTSNLIDYYPLTSEWLNPTVTFVETGLPTGTSWSITLGTNMKTSMAGSIVYSPNNAQYMNQTYTVSQVSGYTASASSGTVYLNGNSRVVTVTFTPYTYDVTFTESGLPSGTSWSVTLNGTAKTLTTSSITFTEPNGTYNYTIGSVTGYHAATVSGSVTVSSGSQSTAVTFAKNVYTLTLKETGLPAGDNWTATVNGKTYTTSSAVMYVSLTSGTYNVSVTAPSGYGVNVNSNVTINNSNTTLAVTFTQTKTTSSGSTGSLLAGIGIGVVVGAVVAAVVMMFYTGTGVFSNKKKEQ